MRRVLQFLALSACLAGFAGQALGQTFESGRLLATSGVSELEGAGGGGLVPWALITGYGTRDAVGGNIHGTYVRLPDFTLGSGGAAVGLYDRVELSYAHEYLDTGSTGGKLGIGNGYAFNEDVLGVKARLLGNAVYDQDSWLPQIAAGTEFKATGNQAVLHAIGAKSSRGVDFYVAATKLFLAQSLLVDATVRLTKANQFGLLGFGGDRDGGRRAQFEGSAGRLLAPNLLVGAEYRTKPDNLAFAHENDSYDVFAAWALRRHLAITAAYADLGVIATVRNQRGLFVSLQGGF